MAEKKPHIDPSLEATVASPHTSSSPPANGNKPPLDVVAKVKLLRQLGRGGMGEVWLGEHQTLGVQVAVKFLLPQLAALDPQMAQRFVREAHIAARIDHPNVVRVLDAGREEQWHYIVMQYVEGGSVARLLDGGPLKVGAAIRIIFQVAQALAEASKHGVVHRDIKPDNLLMTSDGKVKLADLGLAKSASQPGGGQTMVSTLANQTMGSPFYMAPEQIRDPSAADARSDIYALGATFYHLLAGRVPFEGSSLFDVMKGHAEADVPSVRAVRPDVPASIDAIISKMLAKAPGDRFQSAAELIAALRVAGPDATGGVPLADRLRQPKVWALVAVALLLLIGGSVALLSRDGDPPAAPPTVVSPSPPADDTRLRSPGGVFVLMREADVENCSYGVVLSPQRDGALVFGEGGTRLFGARDLSPRGRITDVPGAVYDAVWTPDGDRIAMAFAGGAGIGIYNARTGQLETTLGGHTADVFRLDVDKDGRFLISGSEDGTVRVWDLHTSSERVVLRGHAGGVWPAVFLDGPAQSPGARRREVMPMMALSGGHDGTIRLWDLHRGVELSRLPVQLPQLVTSLAIVPEHRRLVIGCDDGVVRILAMGDPRNPRDEGEITALQGTGAQVQRVAMSSDGSLIAAAATDGSIALWQTRGGELLERFVAHEDAARCVAFSADGNMLYSIGADGLRLWRINHPAANDSPGDAARLPIDGRAGRVRSPRDRADR